jgi:hypothetical protein
MGFLLSGDIVAVVDSAVVRCKGKTARPSCDDVIGKQAAIASIEKVNCRSIRSSQGEFQSKEGIVSADLMDLDRSEFTPPPRIYQYPISACFQIHGANGRLGLIFTPAAIVQMRTELHGLVNDFDV